MAIISGVVRKDEDPVEGAKVYILYDGEVVASAETDTNGEYLCDDLDDDKKYHAVVEHSETEGEEVTLFSARSMPGITPAEDPRFFLYKDGEGGENWDDEGGDPRYAYFGKGSTTMYIVAISDSGGGNSYNVTTKEKYDFSDYNYVKIEYSTSTNYSYIDQKAHLAIGIGRTGWGIYPVETLEYLLWHEDEWAIGVIDISTLTGEYYIQFGLDSGDEAYDGTLSVARIWLE